MIRASLLLIVLSQALPPGARAEETSILDLIPEDALLGIGFRDLKPTWEKAEKLQKDLLRKDEVPRGGMLELRDDILKAIGVTAGYSLKIPMALVVVEPDTEPSKRSIIDDLLHFVAVVPIEDIWKVTQNFNVETGWLKSEAIVQGKNKDSFFGDLQLCRRGEYLYVAKQESAIRKVLKSRSLRKSLRPDQLKMYADTDLVVHVRTQGWATPWKKFTDDFDTWLRDRKVFPDDKARARMVETFGAIRSFRASARIDDGLKVRLATDFDPKNATAKEVLAALRAGDGSVDLRGLPEGDAILVQGSFGDGTQTAFLNRVLLDYFRKSIAKESWFSVADETILMGIVDQIWPRLRGNAMAVYRNPDREKHGPLSLVLIQNPDDPAEFVSAMKQIARFARADGFRFPAEGDRKEEPIDIAALVEQLGDDKYRVRQAASLKLTLLGEACLPQLERSLKSPDAERSTRCGRIRDAILAEAKERREAVLSKNPPAFVRPKIAFASKPEVRDGFEIETLLVGLPEADKAVDKRMKSFFGPDWAKIRMVRTDKRIVLMVGSDERLLFDTLKNLRDGKPGLADSPTVSGFRKRVEPQSKLEVHASFGAMVQFLKLADLKGGEPVPKTRFTSFSGTIEADRIGVEIWLPATEMRAIRDIDWPDVP